MMYVSSNLYCGLETSCGELRKSWIAQNADSVEELVLSHNLYHSVLALIKIRQIQKNGNSQNVSAQNKAAVLSTSCF